MPAAEPSLKQQAHALIDQLPDTAGWQEVIDEVSYRMAVQQGLAQADAGQFAPPDAVRAAFLKHGTQLEA